MKNAQKVLRSSMLTDFKAFIMKGNVVDMAVGIIIGAAFGAIVTSIVKDVVMPPIGLALGNIDFSNLAIIIKKAPRQALTPRWLPPRPQALSRLTTGYSSTPS